MKRLSPVNGAGIRELQQRQRNSISRAVAFEEIYLMTINC